ncbi:MAG: hypothetical protein AAF533_24345, partial [Acidobacteriota bacterium]
MRLRSPIPVLLLSLLTLACRTGDAPSVSQDGSKAAAASQPVSSTQAAASSSQPALRRGQVDDLIDSRELRLGHLRKLTAGGENAEAYWSWDDRHLVFQAKRGDEGCDSIRVMRADGTGDTAIATDGAHTCAYFLKGDERVVYSSTVSGGAQCPPPADRSQGYVWPLHENHEIYSSRPDGSDVRRLTDEPGYDAEATVGPDGTIVFTSDRDGDLEIYTMKPDGSDVRRLTTTPGYDGGP